MTIKNTTSSTTSRRVYHQRVKYLYQGGIRSVSFNIINSVLLLGVFWFQLPPTNLVIWVVVLTLVSAARMVWISLSLEREWNQSKDRHKLYAFRTGALATGTIWGAGFTILAPELNDTYTLLFLFTIAGMSSGAFSSMASDRLAYLMYILPMLIPATIITALQVNLLSLVMSIMLVLFTAMLAVSHKLATRTFAEGFAYRFEHEDLVQELLSKNDALHTMNLELKRTKDELSTISLSDELTGIPNRRHLTQRLDLEFERARREHTPLSIIMIDVDHFKKYNDTYGHSQGDQCLQSIAQHLQMALQRSSDFLARYGGEEFIVLLPNTTHENALFVAERIRTSILNANIEHSGCPIGKVTISAGIAGCSPSTDRANCSSLIELADRSLYQAKQEGRNRVASGNHASVVVPLIPGGNAKDESP